MDSFQQLPHGEGEVRERGHPDKEVSEEVHEFHQPKLPLLSWTRGHLQQLAGVQKHRVELTKQGHAGEVDEHVLTYSQSVAKEDHHMVQHDVPGALDVAADERVNEIVEEVSPGEGDEQLGGESVSVQRVAEELRVCDVTIDATCAGQQGVGEGHEDVQPPVLPRLAPS